MAPLAAALLAALVLGQEEDVTGLDAVAVPASQQGSGPNLLVANPGDLLDGVFSLEYERALLPWLGVTVGAQVWGFRGVLAPTTVPPPSFIAALGPELGVRVHPAGVAPRGYWVGLTAGVEALLSRSDGPLARRWAWGMGLSTGYTYVLERSLSFQFGVGGRFVDYGDVVVWSPRLVLAVGSAF